MTELELGQLITALDSETSDQRERMFESYKEYMGRVPITSREFDNELKINSKLANDFRGEIVDGIVGYMFGKPVIWKHIGEAKSSNDKKRIETALRKFRVRSNVAELDAQTAEHMAVCGVGARLLFIDKNGDEKAKNVMPWDMIFIDDNGGGEVKNALHIFEREVRNGPTVSTERIAEWYTDRFIHFYVESGNSFVKDERERRNPRLHMFDEVPVIRFANNPLLMGDFDKVKSLIDAYDRVCSDSQNEIEEFRLAYMAFIGAEPTDEVIAQARRTGAFGLSEGTDIKFITKQVDGKFIDDHLKRLSENIYKFAKAVDMSDENFSGYNQSGESRRWKLVSFENRAVAKERRFEKGLRDMLRVLSTALEKKKVFYEADDFEFVFTRNLPVDLLYTADVTQKLKGLVSEDTRLSLLPFVSDVAKEKGEMEKERASRDEERSPLGSSGY